MRFDFRIINVTGDYWESILEDYESIIWTVNHNDVGECEIKAPATEENLNLLKMNRLIMNMNKAKVTVPGYNVNNPHAAYTTQIVNEGCVITSVEIDDAALETLSAEEIAVDRMTLEKVRDYLAKQDDELRRIFLLRFQLDLSLNEIAWLLGISRTRVGNRLYCTLEKLREMLKA